MKRRIWTGLKAMKAAAGDHQLPREGRGGEANAPVTASPNATDEFDDTYELTTNRPASQVGSEGYAWSLRLNADVRPKAWDPVTFVLDYILRVRLQSYYPGRLHTDISDHGNSD